MRNAFVGLGGWLRNSFIDYPGTVSTVLFFSGCNLRCPYCHNPDLACGRQDISAQSDEIWAFLEKRRGLIDGVVFSGGEPTIQPAVPELCRQIKEMGYRTKLDSNGLLPEVVHRCSPDYFALDIKTIPSRYGPLLGAPYKDVSGRLNQSVNIVKTMGEQAEVRITIAPGLIDQEVITALAGMLSGVSRVYLQPLNQNVPLLDPAFTSCDPISGEGIELCRQVLAPHVGMCAIR